MLTESTINLTRTFSQGLINLHSFCSVLSEQFLYDFILKKNTHNKIWHFLLRFKCNDTNYVCSLLAVALQDLQKPSWWSESAVFKSMFTLHSASSCLCCLKESIKWCATLPPLSLCLIKISPQFLPPHTFPSFLIRKGRWKGNDTFSPSFGAIPWSPGKLAHSLLSEANHLAIRVAICPVFPKHVLIFRLVS